MSEGDEDALVIQQFEETVIEPLQNDLEAASCLNADADARKPLMDKAPGRGFWGPSKSFKRKRGQEQGGLPISVQKATCPTYP